MQIACRVTNEEFAKCRSDEAVLKLSVGLIFETKGSGL